MRVSRSALLLFALALTIAVAGYGGAKATRNKQTESRSAFSLSSSAFGNNKSIPAQYAATGQGISPPLRWGKPPQGTRAMALIMVDRDAPGGHFVHWVLYGIPATAMSLPANVPKSDTLPQQSGIKQGKNDMGTIGYTPPNPPPGRVHHYVLRLYALNAPVGLTPGAPAAEVEKAMAGHILRTTELTGTVKKS